MHISSIPKNISYPSRLMTNNSYTSLNDFGITSAAWFVVGQNLVRLSCIILPQGSPCTYRRRKPNTCFTCFIGYDPLENQYKVLFLSKTQDQSCQVFTLGETTEKWKNIQGVGSHQPLQGAVCINGTIYYQAGTTEYDSTSLYKLMSFDVRSERFYHVDAPKTLMDYRSFLINYQGKLGFVCCEKGVEIWVMETQGWSKIFFKEMEGSQDWCSMGVTRRGEILFVKWKYHTRYDNLPVVLYYNPNVNGKRCVFLEDIYLKARRHTRFFNIWAVPDYVENTMRLY